MHGNVDEWCSDDYDQDAYLKNRPVRDLSASVVRRGGNWLLNAGEARAARRHPDNSRYSSCHTGFRIIRRQASDVATDLKYFPVLQFYDPTTKQFAFTYGEEEADLWRKLGMEDSALLGYAVTQKIPGTKPVFRIQPRPREFLYYFSAPQNIRANDVDTFSLFVWRSSGAGKVAIFGTSASNGSNIFLSRDKKAVEKYRDDQMEKFGRKLKEVEQLFYLQASMP